jgi:4-hydroxybenzoate polyprenyltransferase
MVPAVFFLSELRKFIRVETSMVAVLMALSGYFIFNDPYGNVLPLALAIFFSTGAGYAYNHYTDRKEDSVNNAELNLFVRGRKGYLVITACLVLSVSSSLFLAGLAFWLYVVALAGGFLYSGLRIKRIPLVKNLYTGVFLSLSFLVGASLGGSLVFPMVSYFLLLVLLTLTSNLMGDIRGYAGDRLANLKTIPVTIGVRASKALIYLNISLFSFATLMIYSSFIPMIPSLGATSFFLNRGDHRKARMSMISTFFVLFPTVVLMRMISG